MLCATVWVKRSRASERASDVFLLPRMHMCVLCTVCGCVSVYAKRLKFEFSQSVRVRVRVCALVCMHWWICHGCREWECGFCGDFSLLCRFAVENLNLVCLVFLSVNIHEILSVPLGSPKAQFWLLFNFDFFPFSIKTESFETICGFSTISMTNSHILFCIQRHLFGNFRDGFKTRESESEIFASGNNKKTVNEK